MNTMKNIYALFFIVAFTFTNAQWKSSISTSGKSTDNHQKFYSLNVPVLKDQLKNAEETGQYSKAVTIEIPTSEGKIEKFAVYSFPVVDEALAQQYGLGSYVGIGIDDPSKYVRFSFSNGDFQSMLVKDGQFEFIEPDNSEKTNYRVFSRKNEKGSNKLGFVCTTEETSSAKNDVEKLLSSKKSLANDYRNMAKVSDRKFRTLRLAISVTGEYSQFFGGTTAGALTAINATLTRVNGVFEKELALHLNLQNFPQLIYLNPNTDPYSDASIGVEGAWNTELQNTLTNTIGNSAYDIGHLFGASGGGGDAGCIGCICVNDTTSTTDQNKGSAFTSPADGVPEGDTFDIDYVIHEMGHQLGANHTYSYVLEGTGVNVEPGSGSTIMGYAGITGSNTDVQSNSDDYFHRVSIDQINAVLQSKSCDVETSISNTPPTISALSDYTIPRNTAFVLTASANDTDGDALTYGWEQVDDAEVTINKNNLGNTTSGASFRSLPATSEPSRYFPKFSTVMGGALKSTSDWEAVSTVARESNFTVTVRDNNAAYPQMNDATQTITVGEDGPFGFSMSSKIYTTVATTLSWNVANTNVSPYNSPNVKIDYTTDDGTTWVTLSESTTNDGSEAFTFPSSLLGQTIKLRISSIGNVFYVVSPEMTVVSSPATCDGSAPENITVSNTTSDTAMLYWDLISGATYTVRYKKSSSLVWLKVTTSTNSITLSGLDDDTDYDVQVAAICSGTTGTYSDTFNFTTESALSYCSMSSADSDYEYISKVVVADMTNSSGAASYSDFTSESGKLINLNLNETYSIAVSKTWTSDKYNEAVVAWIDYNRDGTFSASEIILNSSLSQTTPVSGSFTVPSTAYSGNKLLRLRVAMSDGSNFDSSSACGTYDYGEVEDYSVSITDPLSTGSSSDANIKMYPNPVDTVLNIVNASQTATYQVYDMSGKLTMAGTIKNEEIDMSSLAVGAYMMVVKDGENSFESKFIKR